ncbi:MAG TPA: lactate racemase domain-containing protein [Bryobacteraceae bacterium]|nr:lactate racemase domain-containing protein [Bryobacteraceae bacterium]
MEFSRLLPVHQKLPSHALKDVAGEVRRQLTSAGFAARVPAGARIAIGAGSRGISNSAAIVRAVVDYWKDSGCKPFIFPAMGSHGAATAEGQADVLNHYGINEAKMGCPVISEIEVVSLGRTADGIEAFMDRNACSADAVMLVGRVKPHTDFAGRLESGLCKMTAIGVGKFAGARQYHTFAYRLGMEHVIRTVCRQVLTSGKLLGGLAIIEDGNHKTGHLEAVPAGKMESREEELLEIAKEWMPRIPIPKLDLLIVNEIGKNISGTGMDAKVINRSIDGDLNCWPGEKTRLGRIFVRNLSDNTYGNGVGIGMAEVTHDRVLAAIDWNATWINSLTASTPGGSRVPMHFSTDRECLERIAPTVGRIDTREVTIGWIQNTLELSEMLLSENLRGEIEANPNLEITGPPQPVEFDAAGDLTGSPLRAALA